tara:strand:+ start:1517 stop:2596 length:1080 start_codon:yes stop_codon:yes gene_type:complete
MQPIKVFGNPASPYTRKILSYLRYKNIFYKVTWGDVKSNLKLIDKCAPSPILLPTIILDEDSDPITDSTPIIREIEQKYPSKSVIPSDPILAFINYLIEDYADEWLTKFMFHFRWAFDEDINNAKNKLTLLHGVSTNEITKQTISDFISDKQTNRLWVVGSNEYTKEFIENNYQNFLKLLDECFKNSPFILGNRPSSCDFAIYGQLTQLISFDPTSRKLAHEISMRTVAWIELMEDLSGWHDQISADTLLGNKISSKSNYFDDNNEGWIDVSNIKQIMPLLKEIGNIYVPYLYANDNAIKSKEDAFEVDLNNINWKQKTFPYQAKCLFWIKEEVKKLNNQNLKVLLNALDKTGCEKLLN